MSVRFTMEVTTGTVHLPRPTGRWVKDSEGYWREAYTDRIVMNDDGTERSRQPFTSLVGIKADEGVFDDLGPTYWRRQGETIAAKRGGKDGPFSRLTALQKSLIALANKLKIHMDRGVS